jgi:hypothetical protein
MQRRIRSGVLTARVLAALALAALAACSTGNGATTSAAPNPPGLGGGGASTSGAPAAASSASPAQVAWAEKACGVLTKFGPGITAPNDGGASDPVALRKSFGDFFAQTAQQLTNLSDGIKALGTPPFASVTNAVDGLRQLSATGASAFTSAKAKLDAAAPGDQAALQAAVTDSINQLSVTAPLPGQITALFQDPQLRAAATQAPDCKSLLTG